MEFLSQLKVLESTDGQDGMIVDRRRIGTFEMFIDIMMGCIDHLWEESLQFLFKDKERCLEEHFNGRWESYELYVLSITVLDDEVPMGFFLLSKERDEINYRWG